MFDLSQSDLQNLQIFCRDYSEALQNAALLIGGQPVLRRTQRLLDDIPGTRVLTR